MRSLYIDNAYLLHENLRFSKFQLLLVLNLEFIMYFKIILKYEKNVLKNNIENIAKVK